MVPMIYVAYQGILQVRIHESDKYYLVQVLDHNNSYFAHHRCPSRSGTGFYF